MNDHTDEGDIAQHLSTEYFDPMAAQAPEVDVVVPVHNEAGSIARVLREFHRVVQVEGGVSLRFIVSEDGSIDGSPEVLRDLSKEIPLLLLTSPTRKGYSKAVQDGLLMATAPWVGYVDGDGQYDPSDFALLYERRSRADLVVGYRSPRNDPKGRIAMSAMFGLVYHGLFAVHLRDPSCPYGIVRQAVVRRILGPGPLLPDGFWWEFYARATAAGVVIEQSPVCHRNRSSGTTRVYRPSRIPRIAGVHLSGLIRLRHELSRSTK